MNKDPLVSSIIPVYNGSNYLKEAIDSALAQTYPKIEIIVVNDGSNDEGRTREIARSYGECIRYLEKENGGVATALNMGIDASRGKYISWLSHDDSYAPEKVQAQVLELERLGSQGVKAVAYSGYMLMDERSRTYATYDFPSPGPSKVYQSMLTNAVLLPWLRKVPFVLNGCSVLCPRAAFEEVGMFEPSLPTTQDYELWFKMLGTYDFVKVEGLLVRYRVHRSQGSRLLGKERIYEIQDLYERAFSSYRQGSDKYDLDLPRVVLELKAKGLLKAYRRAKQALVDRGLTARGVFFITLAMMTNRTTLFLVGSAKGAWRRVRKAFLGARPAASP